MPSFHAFYFAYSSIFPHNQKSHTHTCPQHTNTGSNERPLRCERDGVPRKFRRALPFSLTEKRFRNSDFVFIMHSFNCTEIVGESATFGHSLHLIFTTFVLLLISIDRMHFITNICIQNQSFRLDELFLFSGRYFWASGLGNFIGESFVYVFNLPLFNNI